MVKNSQGRKYKLNVKYQEAVFLCDVVDMNNRKSINYDIQFWYNNDDEKSLSEVKAHFKKVRQVVSQNTDYNIFGTRFISLSDTPVNTKTARDFYNKYQFVFYFKNPTEHFGATKYFTELSEKIHQNCFANNDKFKGRK